MAVDNVNVLKGTELNIAAEMVFWCIFYHNFKNAKNHYHTYINLVNAVILTLVKVSFIQHSLISYH